MHADAPPAENPADHHTVTARTPQDWGDRNVCMLLPTSVPGEWAFRIIHSGRYDHHCRVKLPSDAGAAVGAVSSHGSA